MREAYSDQGHALPNGVLRPEEVAQSATNRIAAHQLLVRLHLEQFWHGPPRAPSCVSALGSRTRL